MAGKVMSSNLYGQAPFVLLQPQCHINMAYHDNDMT